MIVQTGRLSATKTAARWLQVSKESAEKRYESWSAVAESFSEEKTEAKQKLAEVVILLEVALRKAKYDSETTKGDT